MATNWYYHKDGIPHGPVAGAELKVLAQAGKLLPTDTVWKEGMERWQPASKVKGLFPPFSPPPLRAKPRTVERQSEPRGKCSPTPASATPQTASPEPVWESGTEAANTQGQIAKEPSRGSPSLIQHFQAASLSIQGCSRIRLFLAGAVLLVCVLGMIVAGGVYFAIRSYGASSYANLDAMAKDFDAVYLIQPRHLVTEYRKGIGGHAPDGTEYTSLLLFRGGRDGIKRIAVGTRGNSTVKMYIEEEGGRLVVLTKDTLLDTSSSVYQGDAAVEYKLKDGVVSGSWRYKWSIFGPDLATTSTDQFSFKLSDQIRYQTNGSRGNSEKNEVSSKPASFNPKNFNETFDWVTAVQANVKRIENPLVRKEAIDKASMEFAKVNGTSFEWQLPISGFGSNTVVFDNMSLRHTKDVHVFFLGKSVGPYGSALASLEIGQHVSKEQFRTLKKGDVVTVKGLVNIRFIHTTTDVYIDIEDPHMN